MGKLFGTDGIRGKANEFPITPEISLKLGKAIAVVFGAEGKGKKRVIIGKDTRLSGYMLENALTAGLTSMGMDVFLVGPMPTPSVAHLTKSMIASAGIMITASHNPAEDNGLKIFDNTGYKLPDHVEDKIEKLILSQEEIKADPKNIGKAYRIEDARGRYIEFAKNVVDDQNLSGLKIVLDCSNGSGYYLAPVIFKELGVEVIEINTNPDGDNINLNCGAMHPEVMAKIVKKHGADCGIALDGDADRVIFCDENGKTVNGDKIIAMCAIDMKNKNKLKNNTVVVTPMTNTGFFIAMKEQGINSIVADVGDRYVIEEMRKNELNLGGEQSGHIIFMDHVTTGDGVISGLKILQMMKEQGKKLSEISHVMREFPQILKNLNIKEKKPLEELSIIQKHIRKCTEELAENGRCLLRYSGTENKLRILVEAETQQLAQKWIDIFAESAELELGVV